MTKIKLYAYPKCSTCVNATRFLDSHHVQYEMKDISITPPTKTELKKMLGFFNGEIRKLFNTSGLKYRDLGLKDKISSMSTSDAIALLESEGMLVKRPFLLAEDFGLLGFKESEWTPLF